MRIVAIRTIFKINIMFGKINLGDHIQWPGCVQIMAPPAEFTTGLLMDLTFEGIETLPFFIELRMLSTSNDA